jgi:hypothetical protein
MDPLVHCATCRTFFRQSEALGRWECVQHAFPTMTSLAPTIRDPAKWHQRFTYQCCGRSDDMLNKAYVAPPNGCIRADHSVRAAAQSHTDADDEIVTPAQARALGVLPEAIVGNEPDGSLRVRRYDWRAAHYRWQFGQTPPPLRPLVARAAAAAGGEAEEGAGDGGVDDDGWLEAH